MNKQGM